MVTLTKYTRIGGGEVYNRNILWIEGLSSEGKPSTTFVEYDGNGKEIARMPIENGSVYSEIDTGKTYKYDSANVTWYEFSVGGGDGGFTPTQAQLDAMNSGITEQRVQELEGIDDTGDNFIEIGGVKLYFGSTTPSSPIDGDWWLD